MNQMFDLCVSVATLNVVAALWSFSGPSGREKWILGSINCISALAAFCPLVGAQI